MQKRKVIPGAIWVRDANLKVVSLKIEKIMYGINTGQKSCLLTDNENNEYYFPFNISYIRKNYPGYNFYRVNKSSIINLNYVSASVLHSFTYKSVIIENGKVFYVSGPEARFVKHYFKIRNKKCLSWRELILWNT